MMEEWEVFWNNMIDKEIDNHSDLTPDGFLTVKRNIQYLRKSYILFCLDLSKIGYIFMGNDLSWKWMHNA